MTAGGGDSDAPRLPGASVRRGPAKAVRYERICNLAIDDKYYQHEAMLNLDLLGGEIRAGTLVAITVFKGGPADKGSGCYASAQGKGPAGDTLSRPGSGLGGSPAPAAMATDLGTGQEDAGAASADGSGEGLLERPTYVCVARDMPREIRARMPTTEILVAKHVADAFGMKRGSPVLLSMVSCPDTAAGVDVAQKKKRARMDGCDDDR
jgi:hypothetical protein